MKKIILFLMILFLPTTNIFAAEIFTAAFSGEFENEEHREIAIDSRDASTTFSIGEQAILFFRFDEPVYLTGGYASIKTNIPISRNADMQSTGAQLINFLIDGNDEIPNASVLWRRSDDGFLLMDMGIRNEYFPMSGEEPFTTLEIHFVVNNLPRGAEDHEPVFEPAIGITEISGEIETEEFLERPEITFIPEKQPGQSNFPTVGVITFFAAIAIPIIVMKVVKKKINE